MTRFAETFGLCGVAFGVLIALGNSVPGHFAWYDFTLTFLLSAAAFSAALSFIGWAFTYLVPANWLSRIVLFAILEIVAVVASVGIALAVREFPHGRFNRLAQPPESPIAFDGVKGLTSRWHPFPRREIVVRTVGGHRFELRADSARQSAWKQLPDKPSPLDSLGTGESSDSNWNFRPPLKLGSSIASFAFKDYGVECSWESHYLLMQDHSLWFWADGGCGLGSLVLLVMCAMLSLLLGIIAFKVAIRGWEPFAALH